MEKKIGEEFIYKGQKYVVKKASNGCEGCAFQEDNYRNCNMIQICFSDCMTERRSDDTSVVFAYAKSDESNVLPVSHEKESTESVKNDFSDDKVRMDLLPWPELEEIAKVYTAGAKKYGPNKWQNLDNGYERYKGAMLRHLTEVEKGNDIDEETGCMHAAQVAWNAISMLHCKMKEMKLKEQTKAL